MDFALVKGETRDGKTCLKHPTEPGLPQSHLSLKACSLGSSRSSRSPAKLDGRDYSSPQYHAMLPSHC